MELALCFSDSTLDEVGQTELCFAQCELPVVQGGIPLGSV